MNIEQLKYLVSLSETGSYKETGANLFLTSQAVSKGMRELAKELGYPLVQTIQGRVVLTEEGVRVLRYAKRALWNVGAILDTSIEECDEFRLPPFVRLGVGFVPARGIAFDTERIDRLKERFPETEFDVTYTSNEACFLSLKAGALDACIVAGAYPDSSLGLTQLEVRKPSIAMCSGNTLSSKSIISVADLAGKNIAQPIDIGYFHSELMSLFEAGGMKPPTIVSKPFDMLSLYEFMKDGGLVFVDEKTSSIDKVFPDGVLKKLVGEIPPIVVSLAYMNDADAKWKRRFGILIREAL